MEKDVFHSCMKALDEFKAGPFVMVIFGGAGDLSQRKLIPTLYNLYKNKFITEFAILGFGIPEMKTDEYRKNAKKWIKEHSQTTYDEKVVDEFIYKLNYESADLSKDENYKLLCTCITKLSDNLKTNNLIYYLAIPPQIVPNVVQNLSNRKLCKERKGAKIVVEKPFGRDTKTACKLNKDLLAAFNEDQIYRIDHYLGKETIQNVFFFRFANSMFEPLWNRNYIDNIQITASEDLGVENRGVFYEHSGVIRDIVQNHIMQLIALVAMEPPANFEAESLRNERIKVLQTIKPINKEDIDKNVVMGQYDEGKIDGKEVRGYTEEEKVAKDSKVPTYFAAKFFIDNWRWAGVPFYVRSGKRLKKRFTEIAIQFKYPPLKLLGHECSEIEANTLVFSIYPSQKISLLFNVKFPGMENAPYPVDMVFDYSQAFHVEPPLAYERLLIDLMKSDLTLFARKDGIEAMWKIVDPIIEAWEDKKALYKYKAGSYGPKEAEKLLEKENHKWRRF